MSKLTVRTEPDDDGVWRFRVELSTQSFSGRGWAWASPLNIEEFASKLVEYPMRSDDAATLALGYNDMVGDDLRVSISISPIGNLGTLEVQVRIAEDENPAFRLKARMATSYAQRDRFVKQLHNLATGAATEAVLEGD